MIVQFDLSGVPDEHLEELKQLLNILINYVVITGLQPIEAMKFLAENMPYPTKH